MTDLFQCDGCDKILTGEPTYTIERTDGICEMGEAGHWHACSWRCIAKVAYQHEKQETSSEHAHGS